MNNPKIEFDDRMLSLGLARVSEAAAIASVSLIGRGDEKAADEAAVNAMREQLNLLDISGTVVIGEGERDEAPMLYIGEEVGTGNGPGVDIALDPLEGTTLTAKDMPNALTVIAMGPKGSMLHAPDVYMEKLAVGPGFEPDLLSLDMSPYERVQVLAEAKNCNPNDITVCILERPRHQEAVVVVAESPRESHTRSHTKSVEPRSAERAERRSLNAVAVVKCSISFFYFIIIITSLTTHSAVKINT